MAEGAQNPRVLVVDDEPNIRELVQVALNFHGCAVTTGATGQDALQLAYAFDPDLIVLDVLLPDIDGFEVCRRLRSVANDVPVIFLTARDATADTVTGLTIGGDDYITKPFSVEALVARVRAVLRRTAGNRGLAAEGAGERTARRTHRPRCASPTWSSTRTTGRSAAPASRSSCRPRSSGCSPT